MRRSLALIITAFAATSCDMGDRDTADTSAFPAPDRPVSDIVSNQFSTENQRDSRGEAKAVMDLAEIKPGMTVADIGAGNGYYTVRLAERVGEKGRVLAQDIDREALTNLGRRVERQRIDNVSIRLGEPSNPKLPGGSFDRIFMVHMYHEIQQPYEFLWNMWPSLRDGGQIIVVDVDRPADQHGIDPLLLSCEFSRVGYELVTFRDAPHLSGYYAQFKAGANRPEPEEIVPCQGDNVGKG